eukprot:251275_1
MSDLLICTSGQENYNHGIVLYNYVLPITYIFSAITMIPPVHIFVRVYYNSSLSKLLFWSGCASFASIFLFLIVAGVWSVLYCHSNKYSVIIRNLSILSLTLYWIQASLLLQILFYRLYRIYCDTVLSLSKCTIRMWNANFVFLSLLWICGLTLYYTSDSHSEYGKFMAAIGAVGCALSDVCYRLSQQRMHINLVTKMSILCFISAFIYLADAISFPLLGVETVYTDFIWRMIILADVYSSFVCILLSFEKFDHWYQAICHSSHTICHSLCTRMNMRFQNDSTPSIIVSPEEGNQIDQWK